MSRALRIRGGSGLGDSIYLRPICEYFLRNGNAVTVLTDFPDIFRDSGCTVEPFGRHRIDVLAHYTAGKTNPATNQWQDICANAKIGDLALCFTWNVQNRHAVDSLISQADGRQIILVHGGRTPMGRIDGFGAELMPEKSAFDAVLETLRDCFTIRVGNAQQVYPLTADLDLSGVTTVADLLDIGSICDGVVGQCSFAIPLAEVFDKPLMCVWSSRGLAARHPYISSITPQKVLSKPTSRFVMDDWTIEKIQGVMRAFRDVL